MKEYRSIPVAAEDDLTLSGIAIVFDQPTEVHGEDGACFYEIIHRHALDNADLSDSRLLIEHDQKSVPLARTGTTMRLEVTDRGLMFRARLAQDNPRALEVYSAVKRGDLSGVSFGFTVDADRYDPKTRTRHIDAIRRVYELSIVQWPAYQGTHVSAETRAAVQAGDKRMTALRLAGRIRAMALINKIKGV